MRVVVFSLMVVLSVSSWAQAYDPCEPVYERYKKKLEAAKKIKGRADSEGAFLYLIKMERAIENCFKKPAGEKLKQQRLRFQWSRIRKDQEKSERARSKKEEKPDSGYMTPEEYEESEKRKAKLAAFRRKNQQYITRKQAREETRNEVRRMMYTGWIISGIVAVVLLVGTGIAIAVVTSQTPGREPRSSPKCIPPGTIPNNGVLLPPVCQ